MMLKLSDDNLKRALDDILFMNGHGIYVWAVYSVGTILLSGSFIFLFYKLRK